MNIEDSIKEAKIKVYTEYQEASGLKVGDKVKVTRRADSFENGWTRTWVEQMDDDVGEIYTISSFGDKAAGVMLEDGWYFPFFVLEKVPNPEWEFLNHLSKWVKSLNLVEDIEHYEQLGSDDKYFYRRNLDMLYRLKKE